MSFFTRSSLRLFPPLFTPNTAASTVVGVVVVELKVMNSTVLFGVLSHTPNMNPIDFLQALPLQVPRSLIKMQSSWLDEAPNNTRSDLDEDGKMHQNKGGSSSNAKHLLKVEHLEKLGIWANGEASMASLAKDWPRLGSLWVFLLNLLCFIAGGW
ncbi:hypothetical protein PanWU01x14_191780 [Parasponia andersonii]|uniref:Uncharacterized protein n=1 Tax=Parasponia andersonii TaxID=3476 RepID=A0A2P5C1J8_PARAD|nr:hypothetical protein PanWU01x14_191780 [Parasponia andersonii]